MGVVEHSLVDGDVEADGDGMLLSRLAARLVSRIPALCELKTFYDGRETVPTASIPQGIGAVGANVYRRFVSICPLNLAATIANSVITNQRPTGFRLIEDRTMRSTEADDMWDACHMDVRSRDMFHDAAVYGAAYAMVQPNAWPSYIVTLSPWDTVVSDDGDSAVVYGFSETDAVERLWLYRMVRDQRTGEPRDVYCRIAERDADQPSLPRESDEDAVYDMANNVDAKRPRLGDGFRWVSEDHESYSYALKCGCLPVVRMGTPSGKGQFEASLPTLKAIDQQRFQRFVIQEMQAFKQRAIKGSLPEYYKANDPAVKYGHAVEGQKIDYSSLFSTGPAALWLLPDDAEMWESGTTDVTSIVNAAASDIKYLAAATGTPLTVLSPDVSGSAEGAKLTTRTLALKVDDLNRRANDAFVCLMRMALVAAGNDSACDDRFETMWEPVDMPSDLDQAQAANYVKEILPVKTIMRRILRMNEHDIAEAMVDVQDTSFLTALSNENRLMSNMAETQSADVLNDPLLSGLDSSPAGGDTERPMVDLDGEPV